VPGDHPARRWPRLARGAAILGVLVTALGGSPSSATSSRPAQRSGTTYAALASQAVKTLEEHYYNGAGAWNLCLPLACHAANRDWGADSLTYALYVHWQITHDQRVAAIMNALTATAPAGHYGWSDVPLWDSIAAAREYQVTHNPAALAKAKADFGFVATVARARFALGACPSIFYQQPHGGANKLKTLETGSNYIKAALLLSQITKDPSYLRQAVSQYRAVRKYFLDATGLYTVYVFDNGSTCQALPARYFGSVNGNMIWAGYSLAQATGQSAYLRQAITTARAVQQHLSDPAGVYADLQAENDITEPLAEAMYGLAVSGQGFARTWLLTAASAAASDIGTGGAYGRFFDGPPPHAPITAWQANGGLALEQAAAALDPPGRPAAPGFWAHAAFVAGNLMVGTAAARFSFAGRAVAIVGTIGEHCCQSGHARVFVDGRQTFDHTGIWQDKSSSGRHLPGSILFAWRWARPGKHTIVIRPGIPNAKEGTSFFHMTGYYLVK
jgi:hypothetical protein